MKNIIIETEAYKVIQNTPITVEYWRNPTESEIKFGEGATHYKAFDIEFLQKPNGDYKRWVKCPIDGLRYNY